MTAQAVHVRQALDQVRVLRAELQHLQRQLGPGVLRYQRAETVASLGSTLARVAMQFEVAASTLLASDIPGTTPQPQRSRAVAPVQRYERSPKARTAGRWITIGAKEGADGKKHGGSPVYIEGGRITKGHPSLAGRRIDALAEEPVEIPGRKLRDWAKGYERAKLGKQARQAGIDPQDLHQLAAEIIVHDKAFVAARTALLQRARRLSEGLGYSDLRGLNLRVGRGIDADAVKGLDDVAERLAEEYPEHFVGHDPQERLFDLLSEGNPKPMSEEATYQEAFDHLAEDRPGTAEDLEPAPFRRSGRPLQYGLLKGPTDGRYARGLGGSAPLLPGPGQTPAPQQPKTITPPVIEPSTLGSPSAALPTLGRGPFSQLAPKPPGSPILKPPASPKPPPPPRTPESTKGPSVSPEPAGPPSLAPGESLPFPERLDAWQHGHELVQHLKADGRHALGLARQIETLDAQINQTTSAAEKRALRKSWGELNQEHAEIVAPHRQKLAEALRIAQPLQMYHLPSIGLKRDPQRRQAVDAAKEFLSSVCEHFDAGRSGTRLVVDYVPAGPNNFRSFWSTNRKTIYLAKSQAGEVEDVVHEMGHMIEDHMPGAKEAARAFLEHRVGKEKLKRIKDTPGGELYDADEFGRKDKFDRFWPGPDAY